MYNFAEWPRSYSLGKARSRRTKGAEQDGTECTSNLVVLDLQIVGSEVECDVDRLDVNGAAECLHVSWNATTRPDGTDPVGRDVIFVWRPPGYYRRRYRSKPDYLDGVFSWVRSGPGRIDARPPKISTKYSVIVGISQLVCRMGSTRSFRPVASICWITVGSNSGQSLEKNSGDQIIATLRLCSTPSTTESIQVRPADLGSSHSSNQTRNLSVRRWRASSRVQSFWARLWRYYVSVVTLIRKRIFKTLFDLHAQ